MISFRLYFLPKQAGSLVIPKFHMQGFTQLHFTALEVLAIIEGVQKRLD